MKMKLQQRCERHLMYLEVFDENIRAGWIFQAIHLMKADFLRGNLPTKYNEGW